MVTSKARPAGAPRPGAPEKAWSEEASPRSCLVTSALEGPRRSLLDLLAAKVTSVEGEPSASEARMLEMAEEAATGTWSPPCAVVAVALRGAAAIADVALGDEPSRLARELRAGAWPKPAVVLVGPSALTDRDGIGALEAAVRANGALGLVLGGAWAGASQVLSAGARGSTHGEIDAWPAVEVAILGPAEIRGAAGSFSRRPKLTELVVYLALHPEGATSASWSAALWPNRRVPDQTVANRSSEARRALGFAADGRPRLRKQGERHLLVEVDCDWARFRRLSDPRLGTDSWRRALELVRGRPFEGLFERQWCVLEGLAGEVELAVVDCGLRLGRQLLRAGDHEGAQWAATRTLKACPFDERLHRLLMRAADAAGNRAGVKEVFRQLTLMLEVDGDPRLAVHPQTAALYARLAEEPVRG